VNALTTLPPEEITMAENTEPTTDATEAEVEVEAHAESVLPLQGLVSPEDPDGLTASGKSTASIVC
jgi:hypothetical protein